MPPDIITGGAMAANPVAGLVSAGISGLAKGLTTSAPAISGGNPLYNDRTWINIAPVGVNLGEVAKNYEGPPENGGFGLNFGGLFSRAKDTVSARAGASGINLWMVAGVIALGGYFIIKRKHK